MGKFTKHDFSEAASVAFREDLDKAVDSGGPWMSALWRIKDGKIELMQSTTWKFPTDDMLWCIGELAKNLFEKKRLENESEPLPDTPLPKAGDFPKLATGPMETLEDELTDIGHRLQTTGGIEPSTQQIIATPQSSFAGDEPGIVEDEHKNGDE